MKEETIENIINFLNNHLDLLKANNFDELFVISYNIHLGAFLYDELGIEFWKYMTYVPDYMLCGSEKLELIELPNGITKIGGRAFESCTLLNSITIPDSITEIDISAFHRCTSLQTITIPNSVTKIGDLTFANCTSLKLITIPNNVIEIGNGAFYDCPKVTIKAPKDSYAIEYAKKNTIKYEEI